MRGDRREGRGRGAIWKKLYFDDHGNVVRSGAYVAHADIELYCDDSGALLGRVGFLFAPGAGAITWERVQEIVDETSLSDDEVRWYHATALRIASDRTSSAAQELARATALAASAGYAPPG